MKTSTENGPGRNFVQQILRTLTTPKDHPSKEKGEKGAGRFTFESYEKRVARQAREESEKVVEKQVAQQREAEQRGQEQAQYDHTVEAERGEVKRRASIHNDVIKEIMDEYSKRAGGKGTEAKVQKDANGDFIYFNGPDVSVRIQRCPWGGTRGVENCVYVPREHRKYGEELKPRIRELATVLDRETGLKFDLYMEPFTVYDPPSPPSTLESDGGGW